MTNPMQDEPKEINLEAELFDHGANSLAGANVLQKALITNNRFRYCVVFLFSAPKLFLNLCCYFFLPSSSCTVDLQHLPSVYFYLQMALAIFREWAAMS